MADINKLITETERLLAEATPGPWGTSPQASLRTRQMACVRAVREPGRGYMIAEEATEPDAALMAAAPAALRALIDEVKRLQASCNRLKIVIAKDGGLSPSQIERLGLND